ncbi:MAG: MipA/OmpV family protein [Rhodospirillales bacterium]|nr:MipA/OmpV family protein [Rhodospirillales bacterium]
MKRWLKFGAAALASLLAVPFAWAESPADAPVLDGPVIGRTTEQSLLPSPATGQRGTQVRTNVLSSQSFQAGPSIDVVPNVAHPEVPLVARRKDEAGPVELGGFVDYLFHDGTSGKPSSSLGVDLQVGADAQSSDGGWMVQPGIDYTQPLAPSWQFSTRLFSTYATEGYGASQLGVDHSLAVRSGGSEDTGLQDIGLGLGLGYSISEKWNIQTQARYQRVLGSSEFDGQKESSPHQFFGGVMVDYKF